MKGTDSDNRFKIIAAVLLLVAVVGVIYIFSQQTQANARADTPMMPVPQAIQNLTIPSAPNQPNGAATNLTNGTKTLKRDEGSGDGDDKTGVATTGEYVANLDYLVTRDGFKFQNYGKDPEKVNLGIGELERMFGDGVCSAKKENTCLLSPIAKLWMDRVNEGMGGGHCEGMAALSLLFDTGRLNTTDFGAASAYELSIEGNEKLQHEIAYWFATQTTEPTSVSTMKLSPNEIVEKLVESFKSDTRNDTYTLGIYKRDMTGGHAITPWAIEDRGDGTVWILVYDNNYPGVNRAVVVDRNANTWKYSGSSNPAIAASEYDGDANSKNLEITPTSIRMQKQKCSFCGYDSGQTDESVSGAVKGSLAPAYNEIWMDGKAGLLITDDSGRRLGSVNGTLVQEIPGAKYVSLKGSDADVYQIPIGTDFRFMIDGRGLNATSSNDLVLFGPGYELGLQNITIAPGKKDSAAFSPKWNNITYTSSGTETPEMIYGIETNASDYGFAIKCVGLESGGTINSALDTKKGKLSVNTKGNTKNLTCFFEMSRVDDKGEVAFGNEEGIVLEPNDTMYFNYANWTGNHGVLTVEIDGGGKGVIDETVTLRDDD